LGLAMIPVVISARPLVQENDILMSGLVRRKASLIRHAMLSQQLSQEFVHVGRWLENSVEETALGRTGLGLSVLVVM
jgi:hypothetical protein